MRKICAWVLDLDEGVTFSDKRSLLDAVTSDSKSRGYAVRVIYSNLKRLTVLVI